MKGFLWGVRGIFRSPCPKQVEIIGKDTEAAVLCFLKLFLRGFLPHLGDADESSDLEILDLLNVLFSTTATPEEKKKRLNDEFDIAMTAEFESEVRDMCNLSKALVEQGIEQGIERGIEQGIGKGIEQKNLSLAKMMIEGNEPIDKIAKYTGYGIDRIKEIAEQMKTPVSV